MSWLRAFLERLAALHDLATQVSFAMACAALIGFTAAISLEVTLRYFFNSPTSWSQDAVSFLLCMSIFFAMPMVTKRGGHVSITILLDRLSPRTGWILRKTALTLGAAALTFVGYLSLDENIRQYTLGIQTSSSHAIPKWPVSAMITYGLLSSSLYMLRQAGSDRGPMGA